MPTYNMNQYSIRHMMDDRIVADVLTHMSMIMDECELHKITKRRGVSQAAYAVAKTFGFRSAYHDLTLWHPSIAHDFLLNSEVIRIPDITEAKVFYQLMLLGEESKKGATGKMGDERLTGNATMFNQVEVNVRSNFTNIVVTMEMTGPAFFNMALDLGKRNVATQIKAKLKAKWGSSGTKYGLFEPTGSKAGNEGYRYVRLIDGIAKIYQRGWNDWVSAF